MTPGMRNARDRPSFQMAASKWVQPDRAGESLVSRAATAWRIESFLAAVAASVGVSIAWVPIRPSMARAQRCARRFAHEHRPRQRDAGR
jgi:hypothetical protein